MSTYTLRKKLYDWDTLEWKTTRAGNRTVSITLLAGEYLHVEEGWEVDGPIRVGLTYYPKSDQTRARYSSLPKDKFDLDDPKEYPCMSCGVARQVPCVGDKPECAYRVFLMKGGLL